MIPLAAPTPRVYRGTLDEVMTHRAEIPPDAIVELRVLDQEPHADEPEALSGKTLAEIMAAIGTVKGLPADLSTNPAHMEGFGEMKQRSAPGL